LDGLFESEPPVAKQAIGVYRPAGEAHFRLRAVPGAKHLRLKRLLDADYAGQEAEIWVDGNLAGRFPPVDRNSDRRWHEIGIDLSPSNVAWNGELAFTITALTWPGFEQPEDSKFTAFTYELWTELKRLDSGFEMNAGLNDAWYNPYTSGQGFFITVFPVLDKVSLGWFTYDTELPPIDAMANLGDPGHRWMTALGPIDGNQAVMNITLTSGGIFDFPTEVERTDPKGSDGTLTLTFDGCNSGTVEYDIPSINRQGIVPIRRVADDNIALCETLKTD